VRCAPTFPSQKPHGGLSLPTVSPALSLRTVSPALVAEYQTRLPDKKLLQAKLHEFYELAQEQSAPTALESPEPVTKKRPKKG